MAMKIFVTGIGSNLRSMLTEMKSKARLKHIISFYYTLCITQCYISPTTIIYI